MLLRLALWSMLVGGAQDAHASNSLRADPMVATFVTATVEEGIWTWIERMEGEVLPEAAHEALVEDAAAHAMADDRDEEVRGPDVPVDIYDGDRLPANSSVRGPTILEMTGTTVVVPPGYLARLDPYRNIYLNKEA